MRRAIFLAFAILVAAFSVAPHEHDGLIEVLQPKQTIERIGACDNAIAHHVHAARTKEPHPCAACLRQHSAGTLRLSASPLARLITHRIFITVAIAPYVAAVVPIPSRGPPA